MSSGKSNDQRVRTGPSHPLNSGKDAVKGPALSQNLSHGSNCSVTDIGVELQQKDELIAALIAELEKAADQLDRVQRTGGDRGQLAAPEPRSELTRGLFDTPATVSHDLRQMAEDWQQSQPPAALERIESQLATIHDMLLNAQYSDRSSYSSSHNDHRRNSSADQSNKTIDESNPSWDMIKQQMLGLQPESQASEPSTVTDASEAQDADHASANHPPRESQSSHPVEDYDPELLKTICETPVPCEVDFINADIDALKKAIVERDDYIIQINRLFRTRCALSLPSDWASLANVPGEMQIRVETLLQHLDVQVRLGEVEMSLDRARLARERSQVESDRETIEKHMKRLGLNSIAELENIGTATGSATDRRWMRFLGPSKSQ